MALPIVPMKMPTSLMGVENGRLPSELLGNIGPGGRLLAPAAYSYQALRFWAKTFIDLEMTWTWGGTYRSFEDQWNVWFQRNEPISWAVYRLTPAKYRTLWQEGPAFGQSKYWRRKKGANGRYFARVARPGTSNHGLGLAIDMAEGMHPREARAINRDRGKWTLLTGEVPNFGFSWEDLDEIWHIRYVLGDVFPPKVLEMQEMMRGSTPPAPLPPPVVVAPPPPPLPSPAPQNPSDPDTEAIVKKLPVLRPGDVNFHVFLAMNMLIAHGHDSIRLTPDYGRFTYGADMRRFVVWFQTSKQLTVDGIIGPQTWAALLEVS